MNMGAGNVAWAAMMSALVVAYVINMRRDPSLNGTRMVKIALIWAAIILGGWFLVRAITGMS